MANINVLPKRTNPAAGPLPAVMPPRLMKGEMVGDGGAGGEAEAETFEFAVPFAVPFVVVFVGGGLTPNWLFAAVTLRMIVLEPQGRTP